MRRARDAASSCAERQGVVIDPEAKRWLVSEHEPVKVDIAEWTSTPSSLRGITSFTRSTASRPFDLLDFELAKRSLEGLLAFQIDRGPAMKVQIKDVMLKELPEGGLVAFYKSPIPSDAQIIEAKAPAKGKGKAKAPEAPKAGPAKGKGDDKEGQGQAQTRRRGWPGHR